MHLLASANKIYKDTSSVVYPVCIKKLLDLNCAMTMLSLCPIGFQPGARIVASVADSSCQGQEDKNIGCQVLAVIPIDLHISGIAISSSSSAIAGLQVLPLLQNKFCITIFSVDYILLWRLSLYMM
ncbi:uncharacterized protein LOC120292972 [Eucalyptus grandis]|uniref:uncharacterized protein LOC120292972 n=1 Tax=Eucalyptus grandis TaxID=71139 RepID=UPI00192EE368|nr:uncharacterized protein LOC120292972 [Eucalyptus grandis]